MKYVYLLHRDKLQRLELHGAGATAVSNWITFDGGLDLNSNFETVFTDDPDLTIEEFRKLPRLAHETGG